MSRGQVGEEVQQASHVCRSAGAGETSSVPSGSLSPCHHELGKSDVCSPERVLICKSSGVKC